MWLSARLVDGQELALRHVRSKTKGYELLGDGHLCYLLIIRSQQAVGGDF